MEEERLRKSNSSSDDNLLSIGDQKAKKKSVKARLFKKMKWRFLGSGLKWKRLNLKFSFFNDVIFKILSVFEAVVLVANLCFFYLFCGCHI